MFSMLSGICIMKVAVKSPRNLRYVKLKPILINRGKVVKLLTKLLSLPFSSNI